KRTRAIFTTNLFGGSCNYDKILPLCKNHKLKLIEDNAQAPGAKYKNKYLGTIGAIGVFSFNVHKTAQAGEGGVLLTDDKELAFRARLKRNHGEQVLDDLGRNDIFVIGTNSRMSEIHAAICYEQTKKLNFLNAKRIALAKHLTNRLAKIPGLKPFYVLPKTSHVYYLYPILFEEKVFGISRKRFAEAMRAEGFALNEGYMKPMHLLGMFKGKRLYKYMPWLNPQNYRKNMCPTVERMYEEKLLLTNICRHPLTKSDIDLFARAALKVKNNIGQLK
ncbi:DegT/DnrJ/EryC1/StrS family aminotransferase, partial [Candidatus Curtissbacteria bacterium]|nr:DegT/DnrJ/EryC1/StrS family aminotransferase [Candidatus Curtissbacteria bacterium]